MKILMLVIMMVLIGCQTLIITLSDDLGTKDGEIVYGRTMVTDEYCYIAILKRTYPYCLKHELKHCEDKKWHPIEEVNNDYC